MYCNHTFWINVPWTYISIMYTNGTFWPYVRCVYIYDMYLNRTFGQMHSKCTFLICTVTAHLNQMYPERASRSCTQTVHFGHMYAACTSGLCVLKCQRLFQFKKLRINFNVWNNTQERNTLSTDGLVVGDYNPPPHCPGTFVRFTSVCGYIVAIIQPW